MFVIPEKPCEIGNIQSYDGPIIDKSLDGYKSNVIPNSNPVYLTDGSNTKANDGYSVK